MPSSTSPSSLRPIGNPPLPEAPKESAVTRLLIAPLTFISFLLSLALIDSRNSSLRAHYHPAGSPPPPATTSTVMGRVKRAIHTWMYRPQVEQPYAYVRSPSEKSAEGGQHTPEGVAAEKSEPWHWHTKQRKMMRMEVADAFELRKRVVVILVAVVVGACLGGAWVAMWACRVLAGTVF